MGIQINRPGQAPEPVKPAAVPKQQVEPQIVYKHVEYAMSKDEFSAEIKNIGNKVLDFKFPKKNKFRLDSDTSKDDELAGNMDAMLQLAADELWEKMQAKQE